MDTGELQACEKCIMHLFTSDMVKDATDLPARDLEGLGDQVEHVESRDWSVAETENVAQS